MRLKTLRLETAYEMRRNSYVGNPADEHETLNDILYKYLKKVGLSLHDGRNVHECVYWWRHEALPGMGILEAFK